MRADAVGRSSVSRSADRSAMLDRAAARFDMRQIDANVTAMIDPELLVALKALSDASRLRIVGLLAEGRNMSVEQLAAALVADARARSCTT